MLIKLKPPGLRRRWALVKTLMSAIFQLCIFGEVEIFLDVDEWTLEKLIARAMQANGQKLSHPEPAAQNNQRTHSPTRDANEGLPPALC